MWGESFERYWALFSPISTSRRSVNQSSCLRELVWGLTLRFADLSTSEGVCHYGQASWLCQVAFASSICYSTSVLYILCHFICFKDICFYLYICLLFITLGNHIFVFLKKYHCRTHEVNMNCSKVQYLKKFSFFFLNLKYKCKLVDKTILIIKL